MPHVQTVLGPIRPEALGRTLMHEHLLCDITPPHLAGVEGQNPPITMRNRYDVDYGRMVHTGKYKLRDIAVAADEMIAMRQDGGRTVVDLTCGGLKPDPQGLVEIATLAGINVVMGCGHYVDAYQDPANHARGIDSFAAEMVAQVREGAWGTSVRAGIIGEIGCQAPWTELEQRVMAGAVIAQQETGASLSIHPGTHPDQPQEVMDRIKALGGDATRTVMGHVDRTIFDGERLLRLADTGCVIEFDLFGFETAYWALADIDMPNDGQRIALLHLLLARGHGAQILISQDICRLTRLLAFGGHGYGHIFRNVVPLMRDRGFSEADIEQILVGTPRRLLTIPD